MLFHLDFKKGARTLDLDLGYRLVASNKMGIDGV